MNKIIKIYNYIKEFRKLKLENKYLLEKNLKFIDHSIIP